MQKPPSYAPIVAEVEGHRLHICLTGADRLGAILGLIESAKESLRLFFYIFANDEAGRKVRETLIDARNRGVEVTLLIDGFGSGDQSDLVFADMLEAGIRFGRFNAAFGRRYLLRNHQKMLIVDGDRALIGGTNIADHYFSDAEDGKSWHDLTLTLRGPAVERLAGYFDALAGWTLGEGKSLRGLVHLLSRHSDKDGAFRWLLGGPFQRLSPLTRAIKTDIDTAQELDMIQAYFAPNWGMLRRLGRVVGKKGRARVITAAKSDNATTIAAARHCYRRLLRVGVDVREYLPQMLHMKLIVADNVVYLGSANFDMRSLFINAEIMLRIEDRGFAQQVRSLVTAHLPHCAQITRARHKARSSWFARMRWLVSYFVVSTVDFTVTRRMNLRRG